MELKHVSWVLFAALASVAHAQQQGVLSDGNSQLPDCAQGCQLLIQAAQACSGINQDNQAAWTCFCQSAYLNTLRSSATGVCDAACTNPTDNQQVSTWYNSNCGSDNGASEHADAGGAAATPAATQGGATTRAGGGGAAATATRGAGSSSANNGGNSNSGSTSSSDDDGDWWSNHYKWIIMVIVLAICLPLVAFGALWLKRRHDRKRDHPSTGFNAGITQRAPPMNNSNFNHSGGVATPAGAPATSGRNSPARTRDAFMPHGYGYSHSDSRTGSKQAVGEDRRSPLARVETPMDDMEKDVGDLPAARKKSKKVLVREKSAEKSEESWR